IGNSPQLSISLLDGASTIPSLLVNQFGEAQDDLHIGALMYLALILFALTLLVNIVAVLMVRLIVRQQG
ncbi:MAG: phosphate ABC transporter permease subunit PstC, partial [Chroococcidiopsidaceae cyanobacterium CP_BM_RX_35]|nr:phosphate ABC transporter permease subunit PstC [Chroococcidiopsidaceae cyanobacterium CP_BM_RX_35]